MITIGKWHSERSWKRMIARSFPAQHWYTSTRTLETSMVSFLCPLDMYLSQTKRHISICLPYLCPTAPFKFVLSRRLSNAGPVIVSSNLKYHILLKFLAGTVPTRKWVRRPSTTCRGSSSAFNQSSSWPHQLTNLKFKRVPHWWRGAYALGAV